MQKFLTILTFMILMFGQKVSAQTDDCGLKIDLISENKIKSVNSSAVLLNLETNKIYNAPQKNDSLFYDKLKEGKYELILSKVDYKKTTFQFKLNCSLAKNGIYTLPIEFQSNKRRENFLKITNYFTSLSVAVPNNSNSENVDASPKIPKVVSGGIVNERAIYLVIPSYPSNAKKLKASGTVKVKVLINGEGNVIAAKAISGHQLLRLAAEKAALASKFFKITLSGQPVNVIGEIIYTFDLPKIVKT